MSAFEGRTQNLAQPCWYVELGGVQHCAPLGEVGRIIKIDRRPLPHMGLLIAVVQAVEVADHLWLCTHEVIVLHSHMELSCWTIIWSSSAVHAVSLAGSKAMNGSCYNFWADLGRDQ